MNGWGEPTTEDVVRARARRSLGGSPSEEDVLLDRYGTGQEMGTLGIPVAAAYEAAKPVMASSPMLNSLVGRILGPNQALDETSQQPTFQQALRNIRAVAAGAGWGRLPNTQ